MANLEGMAIKFNVLKVDDIKHHLSLEQKLQLLDIFRTISAAREKEGKQDNQYLVINVDEPYADRVIDIMKHYGHWGPDKEEDEDNAQ